MESYTMYLDTLGIFFMMFLQFSTKCLSEIAQVCTQLPVLYIGTYSHRRTHHDCESALNKYGCLHPDLPKKQSRLFKQQPVKASIQFCSEARFPLNGPLRLSDNS